MVVADDYAFTGSYNLSHSGEENAENVLEVEDAAFAAELSSFVEEIRALRGMHPDRAPVIAAGAVVVREALAHFGLDELEVSEHDIMHGAALEAAAPPKRAEGPAPPGAHTCC